LTLCVLYVLKCSVNSELTEHLSKARKEQNTTDYELKGVVFSNILKTLSNGKSRGISGVSNELLKC